MPACDTLRRMPVNNVFNAKLVARAVPGAPDYAVSVDGRVFSRPRVVTSSDGKKIPVCGGELQGSDRKDRVIAVHPKPLGCMNVGRVVLLAFRGQPPPGHECCHNDGNHRHNFIGNLRWGTRAENLRDKIRHGTHKQGESVHFARLTEPEVSEIKRLRCRGWTLAALAGRFGVALNTIHYITAGKTWKHVA